MDHAVLIDLDVQAGAGLVKALQKEGDLSVALWAVFPDYYSPRLVLASEWIDSPDPLIRYEKVGEILRRDSQKRDDISLFLPKMDDPFVRDLRERLSNLPNIEGMRLDSQSFGGRFLEDGYVYIVR